MPRKITPFIENIAESGAACLVTMVQGNILALGLSHWLIASQTGLVAGTAAAAAIALTNTDNRLVVAAVLGAATAFVDYLVHPGMFGPIAMEAIVTGVGAALLSYLVGTLIGAYRKRRAAPS
ncbi:MAG: hypothetical protein OEO82_00050 [Gammaproteobacteria bacterium]|nr:hypothetical protein [Gammaproteobacteria bacterium]